MRGKHPVSVPYTKRSSLEVGFRDVERKPQGGLSLKMPGSNPDSQQEYEDQNDRKNLENNSTSDITPTNVTSETSVTATNYSTSTEKGSIINDQFYRPDPHEQMQLDADSKVAPYVSFANFDEEAWLVMRSTKRDNKV